MSSQPEMPEINPEKQTRKRKRSEEGEDYALDDIGSYRNEIEEIEIVVVPTTTSQIPVDVAVPAAASGIVQASIYTEHTSHDTDMEPTVTRVIKSLVIAGLPSIIASFSAIAASLGARTPTPSVLAEAIGIVFAVLLMAYLDLYNSRREHSGSGPNPVTLLHVVMTTIGIVVGSLLPPLIYFYFFRRSDDHKSKFIVVATVCILFMLLQSIARAIVQGRPRPYLRTVGGYMACGLLLPTVAFGVSRFARYVAAQAEQK